MTDQRPVHLEVDCSTGATTNTPLTNDEWAAQKTAMAQAVEDEKARAAADEQFRATIAAHPDPAFRELAQRLGLSSGQPTSNPAAAAHS